MYSQRLYKIYSFVLYLGKFFGVTPIRFNKSERLFYCDKSKRVRISLIANFVLVILFFIGYSAQTVVLHLRKDYNRIYLTLPFLISVCHLAAILSLSVFFSDDLCLLLNGLLKFLNHLHSKFIFKRYTIKLIDSDHFSFLCFQEHIYRILFARWIK